MQDLKQHMLNMQNHYYRQLSADSKSSSSTLNIGQSQQIPIENSH